MTVKRLNDLPLEEVVPGSWDARGPARIATQTANVPNRSCRGGHRIQIGMTVMKIIDVRVCEVSIPRVYDTYTADPAQFQCDTDHSRSRYQVIELFTKDGHVGLGEI